MERRNERRLDAQGTSQLELKRIEVEVEQIHLKRDDLKAAQEEADIWQAKYYTLFVSSKEKELELKLELAQSKEIIGNLMARLKIYEKNPTNVD